MKTLVIVSTILFVQGAFAIGAINNPFKKNSCYDDAREVADALAPGEKAVFATYFDGWIVNEMPGSFLKPALMKPMQKACGKHRMRFRGYSNNESGWRKAAECAAAWQSVLGNRVEISVFGHSFGGGMGAIPAAQRMKARGLNVKNLVVYDPREWDSRRGIMKDKARYSALSGVNTVNYRQDGGLPGEFVANSDETTVNGINHGALPFALASQTFNKLKGAASCAKNGASEARSRWANNATPGKKGLSMPANFTKGGPNSKRKSKTAYTGSNCEIKKIVSKSGSVSYRHFSINEDGIRTPMWGKKCDGGPVRTHTATI